MSKDLTRRGFLTGTGLAGLGVIGGIAATTAATFGLPTQAVAATTESSAETSTGSSGSNDIGSIAPSTAHDTTYGAILNPQEDFTSATTDFSAIFSPLTVGKTLKNRLGKSAASSEMQYDPEWPDEAAISYYEQFCKGGCGIVCFEYSNFIPRSPEWLGNTFPEGPGGMHWLDISSDDGIPAHKEIVDRLHKYDTVVLAQMWDLCMSTGGGGSFVGNAKHELGFNPGFAQTTENVKKEIRFFIDGAVRYKKAGFDGIELNASCNHYLSTFLSRICNNERTDEYGGQSIENRCRVITQIIEGVRKECGKDFVFQVLYSGVEENVESLGENSLCTTVDEACEMAKFFEKAGADSLHIRSQMYGNHAAGFILDLAHYNEHGDYGYGTVVDYDKHIDGMVVGKHDGVGGLIDVAAKIKRGVSIPVGVVGACDPRLAPDLMNNAIRDGKIDFILMTRPLLADTQMINKLQAGKRDEIAPCTHCMTCLAAPYDVGVAPMFCRVNAAMSNAYEEDMPEGYDPLPAPGHQFVMVVGAGPAGMEAARICAQRGHNVIVYEKQAEVGGLMNFTTKVKGPHERNLEYIEYLRRQLEVWGVTLVKNHEVTLDFIKTERPDTVVFATGSLYPEPPFPASGTVYSIQDFYEGKASIDDMPHNIVIYGAQLYAADMAKYFVKAGKKVTILNFGAGDEGMREGDVLKGAPTWPRRMGKAWLNTKGVKIYNNAVVEKAEGGIDSSGTVTFASDYGTTVTLDYDAFVNGMPLTSNLDMYNAVSELAAAAVDEDPATAWMPEVFAAGNCQSAGTIAHAVLSGNLAGRNVGGASIEFEEELLPNQYKGTAMGFGKVSVTITVDSGAVSNVSVNTRHETAGIARHLGDQYADQIMATGNVDTISGATVTSDAVREALTAAKASAGL